MGPLEAALRTGRMLLGRERVTCFCLPRRASEWEAASDMLFLGVGLEFAAALKGASPLTQCFHCWDQL